MADNRTMAQLLEAPTEGYEDAIVVPEITTNNFEIKHGLLNLVQNKQFFGHDKEDPHAHIRYFNKITSTMKFPNVPSTQNQRDLPRDNPLVSVEVLRYDIKRSKSENKGIVPTEMELVLEQTQQGTSHEVSKDSILQAGNPVKEILLKLNLPDPRSIPVDSKIHIKIEMEVPGSNKLKDS
ncbi:hypothetical protein Tco_1488382 [Tanacetum coccineum]